jgi:hypothetical protein
MNNKQPEGANRDFSASRSQASWNAAANGDTTVFARHDLGVCSVRLLGANGSLLLSDSVSIETLLPLAFFAFPEGGAKM